MPEIDFKTKLYLTPQTSGLKVERIKEVSRKIILRNAQSQADRKEFEESL